MSSLMHCFTSVALLIHSITASIQTTLDPLNYTYDAVTGSSVLPRADDAFAVGYSTNISEIIIVGGLVNQKQVITFDPSDIKFTDLGVSASDVYVQGTTKFYTQIDDTLWMINKIGTGFLTMDTNSLQVEDTNIVFPEPVGVHKGNLVREKACLVSYNSYLFMVGGQNGTVQIYDTINDDWVDNVPLLHTPRYHASCAVADDSLYIIGGIDATDTSRTHRLDTVEVFDIVEIDFSNATSNDTMTNDTMYTYVMNETLSTAISHSYALVYGEEIIVIGGYDGSAYVPDIQVIDTSMETVTVRGELADTAIYTAPIIVDDILYIFGGYSSTTGLLNTWQYVVLEGIVTEAPTMRTTEMTGTNVPPTMAPSVMGDVETTDNEGRSGDDGSGKSDVALIVFGVVTASAFIGVVIILIARKRRKEQAIVTYDSAQNLLNNEVGSNTNYDRL